MPIFQRLLQFVQNMINKDTIMFFLRVSKKILKYSALQTFSDNNLIRPKTGELVFTQLTIRKLSSLPNCLIIFKIQKDDVANSPISFPKYDRAEIEPNICVDYRVGLLYCPILVYKIIEDFKLTYQVTSSIRDISTCSKAKIFDFWIDGKIATKQFSKNLIEIERSIGNTIQLNELKEEGVQILRRNDAVKETIQVNREQFEKYSQDQETEMFEGEDEALNSDEENNRDLDNFGLTEEMEEEEFQFKNKLEDAYENYQNKTKIFDFDKENVQQLLGEAIYNKNTWELSYDDRTQLRNYIFSQKYKNESLYAFEYKYRMLQLHYKNRDLEILISKQIVGATVTGCAKYADMLSHLNCRIMIIEEAAEVLESHVVAILTSNVQHLILIGDHQQLRPKLESYYLEQKYQTNISLFERMVMSGLKLVTLENQRRMKQNLQTSFDQFTGIDIRMPNASK